TCAPPKGISAVLHPGEICHRYPATGLSCADYASHNSAAYRWHAASPPCSVCASWQLSDNPGGHGHGRSAACTREGTDRKAHRSALRSFPAIHSATPDPWDRRYPADTPSHRTTRGPLEQAPPNWPAWCYFPLLFLLLPQGKDPYRVHRDPDRLPALPHPDGEARQYAH